ncbi:discoidin domain-containing protein [Lysinibacillus xylanilyticus]|uniref:discoidin domain-containing protein n=1 Tax=Lysinibacillus xylanilyticus TaxID=582475 RepID=UPI003824FD2A
MKKILLMFLFSIPFFIFSTIGDAHAETSNSTSLIPKMTSNNAPSGKATSSAVFFEPYLAFDGVPHYSKSGAFYAWGTSATTGWLAYEFNEPKVLNKYVLYYGDHQSNNPGYTSNLPNSWTFEGSNDGVNWVELDKVSNYTAWKNGENAFTITNNQSFKHFRINVTKNNGSVSNQVNLTIHELELWGYDTAEKPNPEPNPDPTPDQNRAILVITLVTGVEKEYDLSLEEVNSFINWYDSTNGEKSYSINRTNKNKGPFKTRKDYFAHDKILMYEVSEY